MAVVTRIGLELIRARRAQGIRLDQPASELCISRKYLKALEREDFSSLPGLAYAIGFLRSYAIYLGLAPDPLVEILKSSVAPAPVKAPSVPIARPRRNPALPIVTFTASLALVVSALYMGWDAVRGAPDRASMVPDLPAHLAALLIDQPEQDERATMSLLADGGAAYFDALLQNEGIEAVHILAVSDVQVAISDAEGAVLRQGILYSGESVDLPKNAGFQIITPDLAALAFFLADTRSRVTPLMTGDLFQVSMDQVELGFEEPVPAS